MRTRDMSMNCRLTSAADHNRCDVSEALEVVDAHTNMMSTVRMAALGTRNRDDTRCRGYSEKTVCGAARQMRACQCELGMCL
jgi:hypothetical protein